MILGVTEGVYGPPGRPAMGRQRMEHTHLGGDRRRGSAPEARGTVRHLGAIAGIVRELYTIVPNIS